MKSDSDRMWSHESILLRPAMVGELIVTTVVACLIAGFYGAHFFWSTGFFTSAFTPALATFFFASIFWTIVNAAFKTITPRKDVRAFVEWIGAALFVGVAAWIYAVFPLNFTHLADVVPTQFQFLLNWITNDVGRILVALILVAGVIALVVNTIKVGWRVSQNFTFHTLGSVKEVIA